mmetsp:Transcript_34517/g.98607  ORF Transcript_34517/g.98607 Transcript_34517/m.98607 type:complete len:312 (+) Transcript_34517:2-937(+)
MPDCRPSRVGPTFPRASITSPMYIIGGVAKSNMPRNRPHILNPINMYALMASVSSGCASAIPVSIWSMAPSGLRPTQLANRSLRKPGDSKQHLRSMEMPSMSQAGMPMRLSHMAGVSSSSREICVHGRKKTKKGMKKARMKLPTEYLSDSRKRVQLQNARAAPMKKITSWPVPVVATIWLLRVIAEMMGFAASGHPFFFSLSSSPMSSIALIKSKTNEATMNGMTAHWILLLRQHRYLKIVRLSSESMPSWTAHACSVGLRPMTSGLWMIRCGLMSASSARRPKFAVVPPHPLTPGAPMELEDGTLQTNTA